MLGGCLKITIEHYDDKYTMETHDEIDLTELLSRLGNLIKAVGYSFTGELVIHEPEPED